MKEALEKALRQVTDSIRHCHGIDVTAETVRGADLFPEVRTVTADGRTEYRLRFNPNVGTLLSLYDLAMEGDRDIGETVMHYVLFHAFLELDDYGGARRHLDAFRSETERLGLCRRTGEELEDAKGQVLVQTYYILFHESFHLIFGHSPGLRSSAMDTTRDLLLDMKAELADQLASITNKELLSHPKTREHIMALIPPSLPYELRKEMETQMYEEMKHHPYSTDYIDRLLAGCDDLLLEELACDRQAWLAFVAMAQADGYAADEDLLQFHLWFYVVFCAMDFNRNLQSQYRPALHEGYRYDGRRVVFRHKAFKTLLRQYNPGVYALVNHHYLDRHKGLEAVFRTATLGLFRYQDDLASLYGQHTSQPNIPDFGQISRLEDEMEEAAGRL